MAEMSGGWIPSRISQGSSPFMKELVGITLVALMELAGPQSYSSPETAASTVTSSPLNLIICLLGFFPLLDRKLLEGKG